MLLLADGKLQVDSRTPSVHVDGRAFTRRENPFAPDAHFAVVFFCSVHLPGEVGCVADADFDVVLVIVVDDVPDEADDFADGACVAFRHFQIGLLRGYSKEHSKELSKSMKKSRQVYA